MRFPRRSTSRPGSRSARCRDCTAESAHPSAPARPCATASNSSTSIARSNGWKGRVCCSCPRRSSRASTSTRARFRTPRWARSSRSSAARSPNSRTRPPDQPPEPQSFVVLYQTEDGRTHIQCRFEGESIWPTQAQMAELFQVSVPTIKDHLKGLIDQGLIDQGQIDAGATIRSFRTVRTDGSRHVAREVEHDSLLGGSRRGSEWQRHAFEAAPAGTTATPA